MIPEIVTLLAVARDKPVNPYIFLICLWPMAFMAVWAVWNSLRNRRDEKLILKSLEWPETQGKVTSSEVVWGHVEVTYQYFVYGQELNGSYKINLSPVVPDKTGQGARRLANEAAEDIRDFPVGSNVVIRYDPNDPQNSVLYCSGDMASMPPSGEVTETPTFQLIN